MDSNRFDDLTRSLGVGRTRRSVVKALGASALGAVGVLGLKGVASAGTADKVSICHRTDSGTYRYITVGASAVPAHLAHGDTVTDLTDTANCGACGNACTAPANATASCSGGTCGYTCNAGYESDGNGGCQAINPCAATCITSADPQCFWQETNSGNYCFVPVGYDQVTCFASNYSCPGCYKWSTSSC